MNPPKDSRIPTKVPVSGNSWRIPGPGAPRVRLTLVPEGTLGAKDRWKQSLAVSIMLNEPLAVLIQVVKLR